MFIPVTTPPPPSPRVNELGEQIALFVSEYRQDNPDLSDMEAEQALILARGQLRTQCGKTMCFVKIMLGLSVGVVALVGLFVAKGSNADVVQPNIMMITIAIGVATVVIGGLALVFAKR